MLTKQRGGAEANVESDFPQLFFAAVAAANAAVAGQSVVEIERSTRLGERAKPNFKVDRNWERKQKERK